MARGGQAKGFWKTKIAFDSKIRLFEAPPELVRAVQARLTIENPVFLENEKMGRWNGETPELLRFYKMEGGELILPRGFIRQLIGLCRKHDVSFQIEDHRRTLPEVDFAFQGNLKPYQAEAVEIMAAKDFGTLSAPTGSGKTVIALNLIARRRQPALIIVHTKELLNQWKARIETFLGIPSADIGVIGNGKRYVGEKISVALVQTLYKCADEISSRIGYLIVDECHRTPSRTFTEAVSAFDAKYMTGLSATPWRRDKLSRLILWYVGDVTHEIEREGLIKSGDVLEADVITRETDFYPESDPVDEYSQMLSELTQDDERNRLIADDIAKAAGNGAGICLVLSDRKEHCRELQGLLNDVHGVRAEVLTGDIGNVTRQDIVEKLNAGQIKVLIATGQLIGEGFDCRELQTLFLTTPIKFSGRVLQYLGRVLRPAPGKERAVVYDYVDKHVGVLVASAKSRQRVFGR
ncbi:MAG: DEAD/DEAH box helicase [Pseudomonadota bacterium]